MKPTTKQAQAIVRQLGTDKANASTEIARLRLVLERIATHESRADRRRKGMVDASELADLQRMARNALAT